MGRRRTIVQRVAESKVRCSEEVSRVSDLARLSVLLVGSLLLGTAAFAQIIRDGTIGPGVDTQPTNAPNFTIPEWHGEIAGSNLFHSFQEFNIRAGESATFTSSGAVAIDNVISRVTGGNLSAIDGLLRSTVPGADFYLINPQGVVFGEGAQLDINGAFKTSTGTTLEFSEGPAFDASAAAPILNVAAPTQFGFIGASTAPIVLHGATLEHSNDIELTAGQITISDARVLTDSREAQDAGDITLSAGRSIDLENTTLSATSSGDGSGGDISLNAGTRITVAGVDGSLIDSTGFAQGDAGAISLEAPVTELLEGASVIARGYVSGDAGDVDIVATEQLTIGGVATNGQRSWISVETAPLSTGNAGNVVVQAGSIALVDGGRIFADAFGLGRAGGVSLIASKSITLSGENGVRSLIRTTSSGAEKGGDVLLEAPVIEVADGAAIGAGTFAAGDSGDVILRASKRLTLAGTDGFGRGVIITAAGGDFATGSGGAIQIEAGIVELKDGARIRADAFGDGDGGEVTVSASESVTLSGSDEQDPEVTGNDPQPSAIRATIFGDGDGGLVSIDAPNVALRDGAIIGAATAGAGDSADITIRASEQLTLSGTSYSGDRSLITAAAVEGSSGNSGAIRVEAGVVELQDGAKLETASLGDGDAGEIAVVASERVSLSGTDESGFVRRGFITSSTSGSGRGGDIVVQGPVVELRDGAVVSSNTFAAGNAGDITVDVTELTLSGTASDGSPAAITTAADETATGNAGTLNINGAVVELDDGARISSQTDGSGDAGSITMNVTERLTLAGESALDRPTSSAIVGTTQGVGEGGSIFVAAPIVQLRDGASITSTTFGAGDSGNVVVRAPESLVLSGNSTTGQGATIITRASEGSSGNAGSISVVTNTLLMREGAMIASDSLGAGGAGNLDIDSQGLVSLTDTEIATSVAIGSGSGGDINIARPELLVLNRSTVVAGADEGLSGDITLSAQNILQTQDSVVDATAGEEGIDGRIVVDAVDINDEIIDEDLRTQFLEASQLLKPQCSLRDGTGQFVVAPRPGVAAPPDGLLPVFGVERVSAVANARSTGESNAFAAMTAGAVAFRGGQFETSAKHWRSAAKLHNQHGESRGGAGALLALAKSLQAMGRYGDSVKTLRDVLLLAQQMGDTRRIAAALSALGNAKLAYGDTDGAERTLMLGERAARRVGELGLRAEIKNNLGNVHAVRGVSLGQATDAYAESARLAGEASDSLGQAKAFANEAAAALTQGDIQRARLTLASANTVLAEVEPSHEKASVLIHLARTQQRLVSHANDESVIKAYTLLEEALQISIELADERIAAHARGQLGGLYYAQDRQHEALFITRQAIRDAESAGATDTLYRWLWQEGRILTALGQQQPAIEAFERAVAVLEDTRQDNLLRYEDVTAHFRRLVAPVYLDLIDALLTRANHEQGRVAEATFVQARQAAELAKNAELRNHFRDDCIVDFEARQAPLETVALDAAIVYPIVLPDRLELLVSLPSGTKRYSHDVSGEAVARTARRFRHALEQLAPLEVIHEHGEQLYSWLVSPFIADLEDGIETLVFVPDGPLRTIPMAALHDGKQYLIEHYAVAVTPSLVLTDPEPIGDVGTAVLLAGVSEKISDRFDALPGVPRELDAIRAVYGGRVLLDEAFTIERFERELQAQPLAIVHIASHATFGGNASDSFVLAYDGELSLERLKVSIGATKFRERPLELLVLSACETAAGDDRSALGLAGVAVRAGARSAIGSLWNVADAAAETLLPEFYRQLRSQGVNKAQALRAAQRASLNDPQFTHPSYWSAFLLINNWL